MNAKVYFLSFTLGFIIMVTTYPLWNPMNNRKMSFKRWTLAALVANATGFVIAIFISRWVFPSG